MINMKTDVGALLLLCAIPFIIYGCEVIYYLIYCALPRNGLGCVGMEKSEKVVSAARFETIERNEYYSRITKIVLESLAFIALFLLVVLL